MPATFSRTRTMLATLVLTTALAAPAAGAPPNPPSEPTWFGYDHCAGAEVYLPMPRDRARAQVPPDYTPIHAVEPWSFLGQRAPEVLTPYVHTFVRIVRCGRGADAVRSLWFGHNVQVRRRQDGLQAHVLLAMYTDHPELHRKVRAAAPSPRIRFVSSSASLQVAFKEILPAGDDHTDVLTGLEASLRDVEDAMDVKWLGGSPRPLMHPPTLGAVRATWYVPPERDGTTYRILSYIPPLDFRMGPAVGELRAAAGTRLAGLLSQDGSTAQAQTSPPGTLFMHTRSQVQMQCIAPLESTGCDGAPPEAWATVPRRG